LAARLAELAVPNELLVTPEVAARARADHLRFEPAGKRLPKGFDEPVTLLALERPGARRRQDAEPPWGATPIVPSSTITGTTRRPRVSFSSSGIASRRTPTSISSTGTFRAASAARAASQCGQPDFV